MTEKMRGHIEESSLLPKKRKDVDFTTLDFMYDSDYHVNTPRIAYEDLDISDGTPSPISIVALIILGRFNYNLIIKCFCVC